MSGPLRYFTLLDWCEVTCPCGATWETRQMSDQEIQRLQNEHYAHTDGTGQNVCGPGWEKCYAEPYATYVFPLDKPQ